MMAQSKTELLIATRRRSSGRRAVAAAALWAGCLVGLAGCQEPGEILADHFENMALIGDRNREDCAALGADLQTYFATHRDEMAASAARLGESSEVHANRIGLASRRLDDTVEPCRHQPAVDAFARDLSALVLAATGLD